MIHYIMNIVNCLHWVIVHYVIRPLVVFPCSRYIRFPLYNVWHFADSVPRTPDLHSFLQLSYSAKVKTTFTIFFLWLISVKE